MSRKMRAKLRLGSIIPITPGVNEILQFHGVSKSTAYPADGSDEDNTFAKFSPSVSLQMHVANPALIGTFEVGDTFYVDFLPVEK